MHILETNPVCFTQLKTINAPEPRDGHTCVYYDGKLVLFGGCEGAEEDMTLFNRVHALDLTTRAWAGIPILGSSPHGRDGHAAAQIDDVMVIYGGNSSTGLCGDIIGFHIPKGTWYPFAIEGEPPGSRESMGCTTIGNSMYVFGGNVNPNEEGKDIYSNDLYRLDIKSRVVESQLLKPLTGSPPARLSCSLSALTHLMLIVFGGESESGFLNDIWIFHLNLGVWSQVIPSKSIESRIAHVGVAISGKLIVFGGLGESSSAINEVATLTFRLAENGCDASEAICPVFPAQSRCSARKPKSCRACGHTQSVCKSQKYPGWAYPKFSHFAGVRVHRGLMEGATEESDLVMSLLNVLGLFSGFSISLKCVQSQQKPDESPSLSNGYPSSGQMRTFLDCNSLISIASPMNVSPEQMASIVAGSGKENAIADLVSLSSVVLLTTKTEECLSACLVVSSQGSQCVKQHFLIYGNRFELIYPSPEIAKTVLDSLHKEFKISQQDLFALKPGFVLTFFSKNIIPQYNETLLMNQNSYLCLERLLDGYYYASPSPAISINDVPLDFKYAVEKAYATLRETSKCTFRYLKVEDHWPFEVRVYHDNKLVYIKLKDEDRPQKRKRGAFRPPCDIVLLDGGLMGDLRMVRCRQGWTRCMEVLDLLCEEEDPGPRKANGSEAALKEYLS